MIPGLRARTGLNGHGCLVVGSNRSPVWLRTNQDCRWEHRQPHFGCTANYTGSMPEMPTPCGRCSTGPPAMLENQPRGLLPVEWVFSARCVHGGMVFSHKKGGPWHSGTRGHSLAQ